MVELLILNDSIHLRCLSRIQMVWGLLLFLPGGGHNMSLLGGTKDGTLVDRGGRSSTALFS